MNTSLSGLLPVRALVSQRLGLALPERFDRHLIQAIEKARETLGAPDRDAAWALLDALPWTAPAWQRLIGELTVRETAFFRQRDWWDSIAQHVLAPLLAMHRAGRKLRCVSIGCASGEEPYSLAMVFDRLVAAEPGWTIEILGLDVCEAALMEAQAGLFNERALREVGEEERVRWFRPAGRHRFALDAGLRARVGFRLFNLAEAMGDAGAMLPGGPADFILCRNVMIHMEPSRQPALAAFLSRQLTDGGALVVAPVEATAPWFAPLQFHTAAHAIFFRKAGQASPAHHPPSAAPHAVPQAKPRMAPDVPVAPRAERPTRAAAPPVPAAPEAGADRLRRARRLADLGLFEEARRLCELTLAASPEAGLLMALVCQALDDLDGAEASARRSLEAAPASPAAHYVYAIICLRTGQADHARRSLRTATQLLGEAHDSKMVTHHLAIDAGQIRQAARRLGVLREKGDGHGRRH